MKTKTLMPKILLFFVILTFLMPYAQAQSPYLLEEYDVWVTDFAISAPFGDTETNTFLGQTFNADEDWDISFVSFNIRKQSSPDGDIYAGLWQVASLSSVPSGSTPDYESIPLDMSDFGTVGQWYFFQFEELIEISEGETWLVGLYADSGATIDGGNYVQVQVDNEVYSHDGVGVIRDDSNNWEIPTGLNAYECLFAIYGNSPQYTVDDTTEDILEILLGTPESVGILIPLMIILLCAFVGYFFAEALGFIAGLNLGVLLCVLMLGFPEWTLIVMIIVDVLAFFGGKQ